MQERGEARRRNRRQERGEARGAYLDRLVPQKCAQAKLLGRAGDAPAPDLGPGNGGERVEKGEAVVGLQDSKVAVAVDHLAGVVLLEVGQDPWGHHAVDGKDAAGGGAPAREGGIS